MCERRDTSDHEVIRRSIRWRPKWYTYTKKWCGVTKIGPNLKGCEDYSQVETHVNTTCTSPCPFKGHTRGIMCTVC